MPERGCTLPGYGDTERYPWKYQTFQLLYSCTVNCYPEYTVRKEMKCSGETEIPNKLVHDT